MLSSDVWAEEVSNANNQLSFIWLISKQSWRRLQCSLASWRDWRLLSLRALLNFSPLARYIRTSPEFWELSVMQGDAKMFYTAGKGCLWVWGNLTTTNQVVLRLILSLHESCHLLADPLKDSIDRHNYSELFRASFSSQATFYCALYVNVFIPFEVREDDVWVASFPKCGTTWTQVILTNHKSSIKNNFSNHTLLSRKWCGI